MTEGPSPYLSTSIVLPLILILLTFAVSNVPLGPLVLIMIIYFASVYLPSSFQAFHVKDEVAADHESDGAGHGLGSILLLVIFLTLCAFFQKGEGSEWGPPLLAVLLFILYNFFH
ncbi:unnamed protein product [Ilex paraguariensis]|uniref:Uncharacterized protein n=1 Tax=Ilex paraguariensis TaxID=185542 RepID=A0ABC8U7I6_9AQUA